MTAPSQADGQPSTEEQLVRIYEPLAENGALMLTVVPVQQQHGEISVTCANSGTISSAWALKMLQNTGTALLVFVEY